MSTKNKNKKRKRFSIIRFFRKIFHKIEYSLSMYLFKIKNTEFYNKIFIKKLYSLSIFATLFLSIILITVTFTLSEKNDINVLILNVEKREYSKVITKYNTMKKQNSEKQMDKLNEILGNKIDNVILNNTEQYIKDKMSIEKFIGLLNTIDYLENINISYGRINIDCKSVMNLYLKEKISYNKARSYFDAISSFAENNSQVDLIKEDVKLIYQSRELYKQSLDFKSKGNYRQAIEGFNKVSNTDTKYYSKAQKNIDECMEFLNKSEN